MAVLQSAERKQLQDKKAATITLLVVSGDELWLRQLAREMGYNPRIQPLCCTDPVQAVSLLDDQTACIDGAIIQHPLKGELSSLLVKRLLSLAKDLPIILVNHGDSRAGNCSIPNVDKMTTLNKRIGPLPIVQRLLGMIHQGRKLEKGKKRSSRRYPTGVTLPDMKTAMSELVEEALKRSNGNMAAAARLLGISRQALSQRLARKKVSMSECEA